LVRPAGAVEVDVRGGLGLALVEVRQLGDEAAGARRCGPFALVVRAFGPRRSHSTRGNLVLEHLVLARLRFEGIAARRRNSE